MAMFVEASLAGNDKRNRRNPRGEFPVNSLLFPSPISFPQHSSGFPHQKKNSLFFSLLNSLFRRGTGKKHPIHDSAFRGGPINILSSPQFGQSTRLANYLGRNGQSGGLNPLYQIGGPRSIQLALKLQF